MNTEPIIIEQNFPNVAIEAVWQAITDKDQMRRWYFESMTEFEAAVGFETQFNVHCEGKDFLHIWKVTEVIEQRRIAYQWRFGGYPGDSTVIWELTETDSGTQLKFTHAVLEPFQGDPIFSRENGVAGWTYLVQDSLKRFLEQPSA